MTLARSADALRPFQTSAGAICGLALDHRDALRNSFKRVGVDEVTEATMLDVKARVADVLGASASALLVDPPALVRCRPETAGIFVPLEAQGHETLAGGRLTQLLEDFAAHDAALIGAHGCKLLLYYRSDHEQTAGRQRDLVDRVVADCHRHGLALVVEPKVYRLDEEDERTYRQAFADLVVEAARDFAASDADLLKLQFPGDARACERVHDVASATPWTLLGGNEVDSDGFTEQLRTACAAGAAGFIAGRPIWEGMLALPPGEQDAWLRDRALPLLERLVEIADSYARRVQ